MSYQIGPKLERVELRCVGGGSLGELSSTRLGKRSHGGEFIALWTPN